MIFKYFFILFLSIRYILHNFHFKKYLHDRYIKIRFVFVFKVVQGGGKIGIIKYIVWTQRVVVVVVSKVNLYVAQS